MTRPNGLEGIVEVFGDPLEYVNDPASWEANTLAMRPLRIPLPYAYKAGVTVKRIRAHRVIATELVELLERAAVWCIENRVPLDRMSYGGCYSWRPKRGSTRLSTHAWGIAVDLDPARNPQGTPWSSSSGLPKPIVDLFSEAGWTWGGLWTPKPDAMHFQAASGY